MIPSFDLVECTERQCLAPPIDAPCSTATPKRPPILIILEARHVSVRRLPQLPMSFARHDVESAWELRTAELTRDHV